MRKNENRRGAKDAERRIKRQEIRNKKKDKTDNISYEERREKLGLKRKNIELFFLAISASWR